MKNIEELSKTQLLSKFIDYRNINSIDANGRVFDYGNHIFRGIFEPYKELTESYFSSGLLAKLEEKGLLPRTIKTNYELKDYALILEHEKVNNLSYIFEWSFEMIKDSALLVLDILDTAIDYGFTLKDSHPYNIMFHHNRPVWVDLTSIEQSESLGNWTVIEFYKSICQPLEFMTINPRIARELYLKDLKDIWPKKVIPEAWGYKKGYTLSVVNSFTKVYRRYLNVFNRQGSQTDKEKIHEGIVHYKEKIKNLKLLINTEWGQYQGNYVNANRQIVLSEGQLRFLKIVNMIKALPIKSVLEFACNLGMLSAILAEEPQIGKIVAVDYDDRAIDTFYTMLKNDKLSKNCQRKIFPMVLDFNTVEETHQNLKPLSKRIKSDALIALAMTHHLLLTQKIPIDTMFSRFAKFTNRFIFVEFMPIGLAWQKDGKWYAPPVPAWYNEQTFIKAMEKHFKILYREQTGVNRILFVGEKK